MQTNSDQLNLTRTVGGRQHALNDFFQFRFKLILYVFSAGLFTLAGAYQMSVWALGKHRNYKKEFLSYPRGRKAIFPFIL